MQAIAPRRTCPRGPRRGYFSLALPSVPQEPSTKYAVCFIDGQNLFHHAKAAFGHHHPNFDPVKLSDAVCRDPDGGTEDLYVPREKGVDLRLGLDVVRMARGGQFDVAVVFSQDQDLAEVAVEIRDIARSSGRWLKIASAYPVSPTASSSQGIARTDWLSMDREFYDACLDPRDYRPPNW